MFTNNKIMEKKILCVLNTFFNYEHIIQCFESIYSDNIDFFILENKSKYSDKIESYFKTKKLIGYLQSEENITHGTVDYFLKNFKDLINQYDYLTITDGDLLVDDIELLYDEIKTILEYPNVKVCCVDLKIDNLPNIPEAKTWIPDSEVIDNLFLKGTSGTHMMTFKKENFNIVLDLNIMMDVYVHSKVFKLGGICAKTLKNKSKHLTWDYYYPTNEYYEWKLENQWTLSYHNKEKKIKVIL
jgi:hypothetical protein